MAMKNKTKYSHYLIPRTSRTTMSGIGNMRKRESIPCKMRTTSLKNEIDKIKNENTAIKNEINNEKNETDLLKHRMTVSKSELKKKTKELEIAMMKNQNNEAQLRKFREKVKGQCSEIKQAMKDRRQELEKDTKSLKEMDLQIKIRGLRIKVLSSQQIDSESEIDMLEQKVLELSTYMFTIDEIKT